MGVVLIYSFPALFVGKLSVYGDLWICCLRIALFVCGPRLHVFNSRTLGFHDVLDDFPSFLLLREMLFYFVTWFGFDFY